MELIRIKYFNNTNGITESRSRPTAPSVGDHVQFARTVFKITRVIHIEDGASYFVHVEIEPTKISAIKKEDNFGNW